MKKINSVLVGLLMILLYNVPYVSYCQSNLMSMNIPEIKVYAQGPGEKTVINKYLRDLKISTVGNTQQMYRMTAFYTNRDLYGKFTGKTKVTGDYTRGLENGFVNWENVYVSNSNNFSGPFPEGKKQDYIENFKYIPTPKMLEAETFREFPSNAESVFVKNLIWDMMAMEGFAWDYTDSLELNRIYRIPEIKGKFKMGDIGMYSHTEIQVCWTGISAFNDELCAVIEYRAIDNMIEMLMDGFKTKGTEQYWGTTWVSLKTGLIESSVMYGGTIQEIEIAGMKEKILVKTIRELWVDKIQ